jgi:sucrose-6-phosphatase
MHAARPLNRQAPHFGSKSPTSSDLFVRGTLRPGAMSQHRFCIVSDLDHTMVEHSDPSYTSLLDFNRLWSSKFRHDSYLVFSTGRSLTSYQKLRMDAPLLTPDLLICSVGTEIYQKTASGLEIDAEWYAELDMGWNRKDIVRLVSAKFDDMKPQADSEQRPHKVSYHLNSDRVPKKQYVQQLRAALSNAGLAVKVVHSGGSDVDVLPACASKGLALQFLQARLPKAQKQYRLKRVWK